MVPRRFVMRILVTAGNTQVPIDRVRCFTNIFTGRTGARITLHARQRGHEVTLLTSHPETIWDLGRIPPHPSRWLLQEYRTFDDLQNLLAHDITHGGYDSLIHCAAVSDYLPVGVFSPAPNTQFDAKGRWKRHSAKPPRLEKRRGPKVKSDEPELWVRMLRAPKLIDRIRSDWAFRGVLVKFKLEVDVSDEWLLDIAERSRRQSDADLMVANTLEGVDSWAFLGP